MKLEFKANKNISIFDFIPIARSYFYSYLTRVIIGFLNVYKFTKNWYDVVLFKIGVKKNIVVYLRNEKKFEINSLEDYQKFWNSVLRNFYENTLKEKIETFGLKLNFEKDNVSFKWNGKDIIFVKSFDTLNMIFEQFVGEDYSWLNVKNKIAVDIGANVGDSSIYFALKGAKHVYSFEPYPYSYNLAKKNIELNNLDNKITLLNEGIGKNEKNIKIPVNFKSDRGSDLKKFEEGKEIKITTLSEVINRLNIDSAVLKIDCEGCEYSFILNCNVLRYFNQIMIEYHYGYKNLVKKLKEEGFKVKHTRPCYSYNPSSTNPEMYTGWIYASL